MTMLSRSPLRAAGRCASAACRGGVCGGALGLDPAATDRLMPMHVIAAADGTILRTGPSVPKLVPGVELVGTPFLAHFDFRMPREVSSVADVMSSADKPLRLTLRDKDRTGLKGQAVPLTCEQAVLIDLSFGISVFDAVRRFSLTSADFGGTDLGIEMLFLIEAQRAAFGETRRFTERLETARVTAEAHALLDGLTGAHNRLALDLFLSDLVEQKADFAVAYIDVDGFRAINELCGHSGGDAVLKEVAGALKGCVRAEDMLARLGGDQFVLVISGPIDDALGSDLSTRLRSALSFPVIHEERSFHLKASVGMTVSAPRSGETAEDVLRRADAALLRARKAGGGQIHFEPALPATPASKQE